MGPPSYMRSVFDRNIVMRNVPVFSVCVLHYTNISVNVTSLYRPRLYWYTHSNAAVLSHIIQWTFGVNILEEYATRFLPAGPNATF